MLSKKEKKKELDGEKFIEIPDVNQEFSISAWAINGDVGTAGSH